MHTSLSIEFNEHIITYHPHSNQIYVPITYRLIVHVKNPSRTTTFTLFNKEAEHLIGVPVENIMSQLTEVSTVIVVRHTIKTLIPLNSTKLLLLSHIMPGLNYDGLIFRH